MLKIYFSSWIHARIGQTINKIIFSIDFFFRFVRTFVSTTKAYYWLWPCILLPVDSILIYYLLFVRVWGLATVEVAVASFFLFRVHGNVCERMALFFDHYSYNVPIVRSQFPTHYPFSECLMTNDDRFARRELVLSAPTSLLFCFAVQCVDCV